MIFHDNCPHLFDLVGLGFIARRLDVDDFVNAIFAKQMMAALNSFFKSHAFQQIDQIIECDILVASSR